MLYMVTTNQKEMIKKGSEAYASEPLFAAGVSKRQKFQEIVDNRSLKDSLMVGWV